MKVIIVPVILNLCLIVIFGLIYWTIRDQFNNDNTNRTLKIGSVIDCFYMSVTIQAGVGYQGLSPITNFSKFLLMSQQLCMITSNIIVVYLIHLHFFNL
jgi:hypothetical protein